MSSLVDQVLLPFQLPFMQQAFLIALSVAIPCALLSSFLILKGWSLMGDAISHAVLPGIVIAYVVGFPLSLGAFLAGMACALFTGFVKENSRVKEDTVMGIVFSGMFALGLVLFVKVDSGLHLDHFLLGNMLGTSWNQIGESTAIAVFCSCVILFKHKDFLLNAFDPQHSTAIALPTRWLHYGLLALIALAITSALKAVGIILAISFLIAPGAIAFLISRRFTVMMGLSVLIAVTATVLGTWTSFFIDSAPAPTIVLIMSAWFALTFMWQSLRRKVTA